MICVDGGSGLLAALPMVYDKIPVQRCLRAQDPQYPQQGQESRREGRQGRPARRHERRDGDQGALGRTPLRRAMGPSLSGGRRLACATILDEF